MIHRAKFLSTLSLRRATARRASRQQPAGISIHALLAESDVKISCAWSASKLAFLSTLSLRRATFKNSCRGFLISYFYPRSPCGERPTQTKQTEVHTIFLSTLSLRRATFASPFSIFWICHFYPRSPCGERPGARPTGQQSTVYFYPRSPCGERPPKLSRVVPTPIFLSTLSLRRATPHDAEGPGCVFYFYPRSPCGERPGAVTSPAVIRNISIHALLAESDHPFCAPP